MTGTILAVILDILWEDTCGLPVTHEKPVGALLAVNSVVAAVCVLAAMHHRSNNIVSLTLEIGGGEDQVLCLSGLVRFLEDVSGMFKLLAW